MPVESQYLGVAGRGLHRNAWNSWPCLALGQFNGAGSDLGFPPGPQTAVQVNMATGGVTTALEHPVHLPVPSPPFLGSYRNWYVFALAYTQVYSRARKLRRDARRVDQKQEVKNETGGEGSPDQRWGQGQGAAEAKLFAEEGSRVVFGYLLDEEGRKV